MNFSPDHQNAAPEPVAPASKRPINAAKIKKVLKSLTILVTPVGLFVIGLVLLTSWIVYQKIDPVAPPPPVISAKTTTPAKKVSTKKSLAFEQCMLSSGHQTATLKYLVGPDQYNHTLSQMGLCFTSDAVFSLETGSFASVKLSDTYNFTDLADLDLKNALSDAAKDTGCTPDNNSIKMTTYMEGQFAAAAYNVCVGRGGQGSQLFAHTDEGWKQIDKSHKNGLFACEAIDAYHIPALYIMLTTKTSSCMTADNMHGKDLVSGLVHY